MIYLLVIAIILVLIIPSLWVKVVIKRHAKSLPDLPGTGGEFAAHLITQLKLTDVTVEKGHPGQDHFAPNQKIVSLSPLVFDGKSVSAIAIAAHEVGHAIQYHRKEPITKLRERYTPLALIIEKIAISLMGISPVIVAIFKVPHIGAISVIAAIVSILISVLMQLIILPMEWDASFNKALPVIEAGNYLSEDKIPAARQVLRAAAMTYVASALSSILNVWRWLKILRR